VSVAVLFNLTEPSQLLELMFKLFVIFVHVMIKKEE